MPAATTFPETGACRSASALLAPLTLLKSALWTYRGQCSCKLPHVMVNPVQTQHPSNASLAPVREGDGPASCSQPKT